MESTWNSGQVVLAFSITFLCIVFFCVCCKWCSACAAERRESSSRHHRQRHRRRRPHTGRGRRTHPAESFYLDDRMLISVISSGRDGESTPPMFDPSFWGPPPPPYSPREENPPSQPPSQGDTATPVEVTTLTTETFQQSSADSTDRVPLGTPTPEVLAFRLMEDSPPPPNYEPPPAYF